jgi:hypothetical protein
MSNKNSSVSVLNINEVDSADNLMNNELNLLEEKIFTSYNEVIYVVLDAYIYKSSGIKNHDLILTAELFEKLGMEKIAERHGLYLYQLYDKYFSINLLMHLIILGHRSVSEIVPLMMLFNEMLLTKSVNINGFITKLTKLADVFNESKTLIKALPAYSYQLSNYIIIITEFMNMRFDKNISNLHMTEYIEDISKCFSLSHKLTRVNKMCPYDLTFAIDLDLLYNIEKHSDGNFHLSLCVDDIRRPIILQALKCMDYPVV